jgi:hypothetical protein
MSNHEDTKSTKGMQDMGASELRALEGVILRELDWRDVRETARKVVRLIAHLSYGHGLKEAVIAKQQTIGIVLRLDKKTVSTDIAELQVMNVLRVRDGEGVYELLPDPGVWLVRPVFKSPAERARAERELADLQARHALGPEWRLLEVAPGLPEALAEQSRETALSLADLTRPDVRLRIERAMRERGMLPDEIEASRVVPAQRLIEMLANHQQAVGEPVGESPTERTPVGKSPTGLVGESPTGPPCVRACVSAKSAPAPHQESAISAGAQTCVVGERRAEKNADPRIDVDVRELVEKVFCWLDRGDAQDREQRTNPKFAGGWLRLARECPRALIQALEMGQQRSTKLSPIAWRWSWLRNRYARQRAAMEEART